MFDREDVRIAFVALAAVLARCLEPARGLAFSRQLVIEHEMADLVRDRHALATLGHDVVRNTNPSLCSHAEDLRGRALQMSKRDLDAQLLRRLDRIDLVGRTRAYPDQQIISGRRLRLGGLLDRQT